MERLVDREKQKTFYQALRDRPLELGDPVDRELYQPLYDTNHDPVLRLFDTIDFSLDESVQVVAGFRGTGKTTEFSRLEQLLWKADYLVIRIDLDEYLDMRSPIEVSDFLLILAGAISDKLADDRLLGPERAQEKSFWERAKGFFSQEIVIDEARIGVDPVSLRVGLRGDHSFRERIRRALTGQLPRLVQEVREYHLDVLDELDRGWGGDVRLVVILDSLEHLRGTDEDASAVHRSVEELFFTHGKHLRLPRTHMVLSVPAFLALKGDNLEAEFVTGAVQAWPACRVRDIRGEPEQANIDRMVALVDRRGDWRAILPNRESLERLVLASGGYIRDLLNMLIEAVHQAGYGGKQDIVDRVVAAAQRAYLPVYADERGVLVKIARARALHDVTLKERDYLMRFLDSHLVLCYLNDQFWYDVHPLVRSEVMRDWSATDRSPG